MKKRFFLMTLFLAISQITFSGGIVTNTNQGAAYGRILIRDASIQGDAVYYNPAGLIRMENGFHFSVNNQSIFQVKTVSTDLSLLKYQDEYVGNVSAPLFPSVYGAFKLGKFAFSLGVNPIGGGGGAEYEDGLPSFETQIAAYVPLLNQMAPLAPVTTYAADIYFEGTSVYFGYQANVSYAITDRIGLAVGGRYVSAKNTYDGYIRNIQFDFLGGPLTNAQEFFSGVPGLEDFANAVADKEVDVDQTGAGFTPLVSLHVSPISILDIAVKYEFKTKLVLTNSVNDGKDGDGIYVDGEEIGSDMPAYLSVGVGLRPIEKLYLTAGFHNFFETEVDWDGKEEQIEKSGIELGLGVEYSLTKKFLVSTGYLYAKPGVTDNYHTDTNYSIPSSTFAFGGAWNATEKIRVNAGYLKVFYSETDVPMYNPVEHTQGYQKSTQVFSIGVDFRI